MGISILNMVRAFVQSKLILIDVCVCAAVGTYKHNICAQFQFLFLSIQIYIREQQKKSISTSYAIQFVCRLPILDINREFNKNSYSERRQTTTTTIKTTTTTAATAAAAAKK